MIKHLSTSLLSLVFLVSCTGIKPFDYSYEVDNYYERDTILEKSKPISLIYDKIERFNKTAQFEQELIEEGVYLPAYLQLNKMYSKLYDVNYSFHNLYDYKNAVTFDKIISNQLREQANKRYFADYDSIIDYFNDYGYIAKQTLAIADKNFLDTIRNTGFTNLSKDVMRIFQTNGHGLFSVEFGDVKMDMAESLIEINDKEYQITLKEKYWKNGNRDIFRKITANDYINGISYLTPQQREAFNAQAINNDTLIVSFNANTVFDIYDLYNWYPYPEENIHLDFENINLDNYLFSDPDYIVRDNTINSEYVLESCTDNYLKTITIKYEDEQETLYSSGIIFDETLDVYATNDNNEKYYLKSYRFDDIGTEYTIKLYYGDTNTPVYNQAIKDSDFRKSLLIFLKNNYELYCSKERYDSNGHIAILPAETRHDFYDMVLHNDNKTSYKEIAFSKMYNSDLSESKKLFEAFKERFKADLSLYPIELNIPKYRSPVFSNNLSEALKKVYGDDVKVVEFSGAYDIEGYSPIYSQFFHSFVSSSFSPYSMDVFENLIPVL